MGSVLRTPVILCIATCALGWPPKANAANTPFSRASTSRTASGFRMEGAPHIAMVFGDAENYRDHVDRFYYLDADMRRVRAEFSRYVRATHAALDSAGRQRRCATKAVAPLYAQAYREGQRYRELGAEFESHYTAITRLDQLGETSGLTPDYRWRVKRVRRTYQAAIVDYREMRAAFDEHLARGVRSRRCRPNMLLREGAQAIAKGPPSLQHANEAATAAVPAGSLEHPAAPKATMATFFIDNRHCDSVVNVHVDGTFLGPVDAGAKAAFQASPGRHSLCLLPVNSTATCGDTGTVRSTHVHSGWTMSMRCE